MFGNCEANQHIHKATSYGVIIILRLFYGRFWFKVIEVEVLKFSKITSQVRKLTYLYNK